MEAINSPIGYLPKYEDLKRLFKEVLNKEYTIAEYNEQFTIRVNENATTTDTITPTVTETVTTTFTATPNAVQTQIASLPYIELVSVSGGTFSQSDGGNTFDHTVSSFIIGKYKVTYELWYAVYQWAVSNGYTFANSGAEGSIRLR